MKLTKIDAFGQRTALVLSHLQLVGRNGPGMGDAKERNNGEELFRFWEALSRALVCMYSNRLPQA